MRKLFVVILGLLVYAAIQAIPIIGPIFQIFAILTGLGALIIADKDYFLLLKKNKLI